MLCDVPKMADQMQRIKSKRLVFQLKPPHFCFKTLAMGLCMLAAIICSVLAATCPALVPSSAATITEQSTFDLHLCDFKSVLYLFNLA